VTLALPPVDLRSTTGTGRKFGGHALCRMCGRPKVVRTITRHHLVPQAWFDKLDEDDPRRLLRNATANLVPLCRPCHDLVDHRDPVVRAQARRMLRRSLAQAEITFAIHLRGRPWLEHHYPLDMSLVVV
jgi:5-methylcytosine-specific restriction endonuclease McrA